MALGTIILKFTLTFLGAVLFGMERQRSHKPIGFPTYAFVAVGACAMAMVAIDPQFGGAMFILGAVVSSVGFLGAGSLIRSNEKIFGFTTAAAIWLFSIFGILIGVAEYGLAATVYILIWMTLGYDWYLKSKGVGSYRMKIQIVTNKIINESDIRNILLVNTRSYQLIETEVNKKDGKMILNYYIEGGKNQINQIPKKLFEKEWFESCKIE